jgi:exonuclease SbcC
VDKLTEFTAQIKSWTRHKDLGAKLITQGNCPQCGQPAKDVGKGFVEDAESKLAVLNDQKLGKEKEIGRLTQLKGRLDKELRTYKDSLRDAEVELASARQSLSVAEQSEKEDTIRATKALAKRQRMEKELAAIKRRLAACQAVMHKMAIDREMLEYARKAFSREGIPLYLSASLCPLLNKAASDWGDLLTDGKLKVLFAVQDSEFTASIINPSGSATSDGQSVGEAATAGLITALSIREIGSTKTNILILDEPGHGLDAEGAKIFAQSLLKLKGKIPTILVTTHNPAIEGVLSGEKTWQITKKNSYSSLIT